MNASTTDLEVPATPPAGMRAALRYRQFRRLWVGQAISTIGDMVFPVAMAIRVLDSGAGATGLGLVFAARVLATVLFVLVGGVIADRFKRTRVMIGADALRFVAVLSIALVPAGISLPALAALTFLVGGGEAFFRPAYSAVFPSLLPPQALQSGNAVTSVSMRAASVIGPAAAGLLISTVGVRPAFFFDAGTFLVSLATLISIDEPRVAERIRARFRTEVADGFRAVFERPWIGAILVMANLQLLVVVAPLAILLPIVARERLGGNAVFGLMVAAFGLGAVAGAVVGSRLHVRQPGLVGTIGILPYGLIAVGLALVHSAPIIGVLHVAGGFGLEIFQVLWVTALQREVPEHLLARVTSLDWFGSLALLPVGFVLTGPAVSAFGERPVLLVAAAFLFVSTLAVMPVRGVLRFSNRSPGGVSTAPI